MYGASHWRKPTTLQWHDIKELTDSRACHLVFLLQYLHFRVLRYHDIIKELHCQETFYTPNCYVWSESLKGANHFTMSRYQRTHRHTGVPPGVSAAIIAFQSLRYRDIIKELHCQETFYTPNCYVWSESLKEANHFTMAWYQRTHRLTGVPPGVSAAIYLHFRVLRYHDIIKELYPYYIYPLFYAKCCS